MGSSHGHWQGVNLHHWGLRATNAQSEVYWSDSGLTNRQTKWKSTQADKEAEIEHFEPSARLQAFHQQKNLGKTKENLRKPLEHRQKNLGQNKNVATQTHMYCISLIPSVFLIGLNDLQRRFMI